MITPYVVPLFGQTMYLARSVEEWDDLRTYIAGEVGGEDLPESAPNSTGEVSVHTFDGSYGTVERNVIWIRVAPHKTLLELVDTIVHEATHAVQNLLGVIGEVPEAKELPAYLNAAVVSWLLEECLPLWTTARMQPVVDAA